MNKLIIFGGIVIFVILMSMFILKTPSQFIRKEIFQHPLKQVNRDLVKQDHIVFVNEEEVIQAKYTSEQFQAGMNVLIYGDINLASAEQLFKHLRRLGINSIAIVFPFYQEHWRSNQVSSHPAYTPQMDGLKQVIELAHQFDLSVMLRPILDEETLVKDHRWRGQIEPSEPEVWFQHYETFLMTYVKLAQQLKVDRFNIGTEFNSLEKTYDQNWITLIKHIRQHYDGELLYSFNWDHIHLLDQLQFVDYLDHIGIDAYFPLNASDGADVERLSQEWKTWMNQLSDQFNDRSVVVTEVGTLPISGSYRTPYTWDYIDRTIDRNAQVQYYEATFQAWLPVSRGIYWWCVTIEEEGQITYSPLHSETENVIERYFLK